MIRSTALAFAAGTALAATSGFVALAPGHQDGQIQAAQRCAACDQGDPAVLNASFISDDAARPLNSGSNGQHRSAAAALGFAVGAAAATMRYQ